jgi:hypothetical protein
MFRYMCAIFRSFNVDLSIKLLDVICIILLRDLMTTDGVLNWMIGFINRFLESTRIYVQAIQNFR